MKKGLIWLLAMLCLLLGSAMAASVYDDEYSDAPANPTQENVISIDARVIVSDDETHPFGTVAIKPTVLTVEKLSEIYDFVDINKNPVARYFPEDVQQEIDDIVIPKGITKDDLYMPEFLSLMPQDYDHIHSVEVDMLLDMTYGVGRLVVVVLGWETEEGVVWKALDAEVKVQNTISYMVPQDVMEKINGQETLFALLTVKPGAEGKVLPTKEREEHFVVSIRMEDTTVVIDEKKQPGEPDLHDCQIVIVDPSEHLRAEILRLRQHVIEQDYPAMSYYSVEMNRQVQQMIPADMQPGDLVPYEMHCVQVINYRESYGDVMARIQFVTPFQDGQIIVTMLGLADEVTGEVEWMPLHTEVVNGVVEVTFSSSVLPPMMERPALMVVLSSPLISR